MKGHNLDRPIPYPPGMFESNYPVDKVSYSYDVIYNAFKRMSRGYSATERAALFHDTAARVYRIAV